MNTVEFWRLQKCATLTNKQAAEFFGTNIRTIERWRVDKPVAPKAVIMCLESLLSGNAIKYTTRL